jgi:hypothetical protein
MRSVHELAGLISALSFAQPRFRAGVKTPHIRCDAKRIYRALSNTADRACGFVANFATAIKLGETAQFDFRIMVAKD